MRPAGGARVLLDSCTREESVCVRLSKSLTHDTQIDSFFCPNCLDEHMPSTEAKLNKNRCGRCSECPLCSTTLTTVPLNASLPAAAAPTAPAEGAPEDDTTGACVGGWVGACVCVCASICLCVSVCLCVCLCAFVTLTPHFQSTTCLARTASGPRLTHTSPAHRRPSPRSSRTSPLPRPRRGWVFTLTHSHTHSLTHSHTHTTHTLTHTYR